MLSRILRHTQEGLGQGLGERGLEEGKYLCFRVVKIGEDGLEKISQLVLARRARLK